MRDVNITPAPDGDFTVEVTDGDSTSRHRVSIDPSTLDALGLPDADPARLVDESFVFLLEREPKESILSSFELSVIGRYFPEYPDEIRRRMAGGSDA